MGTLDLDAKNGCGRSSTTAYSADGGLAILSGHLAPDGCVVKTAGVPPGSSPQGAAKVSESQEEAVTNPGKQDRRR